MEMWLSHASWRKLVPRTVLVPSTGTLSALRRANEALNLVCKRYLKVIFFLEKSADTTTVCPMDDLRFSVNVSSILIISL
jgi:hypothetical protein